MLLKSSDIILTFFVYLLLRSRDTQRWHGQRYTDTWCFPSSPHNDNEGSRSPTRLAQSRLAVLRKLAGNAFKTTAVCVLWLSLVPSCPRHIHRLLNKLL